VEGMVKAANKTKADLVELRLDHLKKFDNIEKLSRIKKPIIATCMPKWEGGLFKRSERKRMEILERTLKFASHVTIELKTKPRFRDALIQKARKSKVKVIVAFHDFKKTPRKKEIIKVIKEERKLGDIAKIAFMPKNYNDVLTVIDLLLKQTPQKKLIALSMGELGRVTRILGPLLGSYLTYATPSKGKEAGPGQMTVDELRNIFYTLRVK
ncbi:MAG: type I 3-dehydroquinate dehydratase, partial [Candidatus Altiarchaeota archaeon]